ncbi:hypothetical protein ZWY2020_046605 [Hordeum vulgare]|nr:hypothetical protein ZWY2020_046605 [Hordeum vulgare]
MAAHGTARQVWAQLRFLFDDEDAFDPALEPASPRRGHVRVRLWLPPEVLARAVVDVGGEPVSDTALACSCSAGN